MLGKSVSSWLNSAGHLLAQKFERNKSDPLCDQANRSYAHICHHDGGKTNTDSIETTDTPMSDNYQTSSSNNSAPNSENITPQNFERCGCWL